MNAATAPPKSAGCAASYIASAITSPIGCSPAALVPLTVPRAEWMSAVIRPNAVPDRVGDRLVALEDRGRAGVLRHGLGDDVVLGDDRVENAVRAVDRQVDRRDCATERGRRGDQRLLKLHTYGWWVCALTTRFTPGLSRLTMSRRSGPMKFSHLLTSMKPRENGAVWFHPRAAAARSCSPSAASAAARAR